MVFVAFCATTTTGVELAARQLFCEVERESEKTITITRTGGKWRRDNNIVIVRPEREREKKREQPCDIIYNHIYIGCAL